MCSATLHEHCEVILTAAAVIEVNSGCNHYWHVGWLLFEADETSGQVCRKLRKPQRHLHSSVGYFELGAYSSRRWVLQFHNNIAFRLSYSALLQSKDFLYHKMVFIIYLSQSIYIQTVNQAADRTQEQSEDHLLMPIESTLGCTWRLWSCELSDALDDHVGVNWEAVIVQV